jgi:hypothetical protein
MRMLAQQPVSQVPQVQQHQLQVEQCLQLLADQQLYQLLQKRNALKKQFSLAQHFLVDLILQT